MAKKNYADSVLSGLDFNEMQPKEQDADPKEPKKKKTSSPVSNPEKKPVKTNSSAKINAILEGKGRGKIRKRSCSFYIEADLYDRFLEHAEENNMTPSEALSLILKELL